MRVLAAVLVLLAGCASAPAPVAVEHVVLFDLVDPADGATIAEESRRVLSRIPGVVRVTAGAPLPSTRAVVDDDYDVGVVIGLATFDDLAAYLEHPEHRALQARWRDRISAVRVIDVDVRMRD